MKNDAWREKLVQKINREDKWFTEEKTDANIYIICSRHFKSECFKTGKFVSIFSFYCFGVFMVGGGYILTYWLKCPYSYHISFVLG